MSSVGSMLYGKRLGNMHYAGGGGPRSLKELENFFCLCRLGTNGRLKAQRCTGQR